MSPRRTDPALAERRREALIKAGYAEILGKGISAVTLDSVVARAGSSKGGALYYFRTKEDLLYAVLHWLLTQVDRSLEEVARSDEPPRSRLAAELEVLFHSAEVNRKLYWVFFDYTALGVHAQRFRKVFAAFFERCRKRDMAIVEEGIRLHQFRRVNPSDAAATIRAMVDGLCLQWLMANDPESIEALRDRCRAVLGAYLLR